MEETKMSSSKKWFLVICIFFLCAASNSAGYCGNVMLPSKLAALDAMSFYGIIASISSLGTVLILPMVGTLSRKFGTRAVALVGLIVQVIIRVIAVYITNIPLFIGVWLLQGCANGLYVSAPFALMSQITTLDERPKFFGWLSAAAAAGTLIAPLISGWIIDNVANAGWGGIGYFAFAILPMFGLFAMPNVKAKTSGHQKFDFLGLFLMVIGLAGIVLFISFGRKLWPYVSLPSFAVLVVGIICMILMVIRERKVENPSVPVGMFKHSRFRTVFLAALCYTAYNTVPAAYLLAYIQQVMDLSATASASALMPQTIVKLIIGMFIGAWIGKNFYKRWRKVAIVGMTAMVACLAILSLLKANSSMVQVYIATGIGGIGAAVTQGTMAPYFHTQLDPSEIPAAQSMFTFATTAGSSVVTAVMGSILVAGGTYNVCFWLATGLATVALLICIFGMRFTPAELEAAKNGQTSPIKIKG